MDQTIWHRIRADTLPSGEVIAHHSTNDDDDDGYPDGHTTEWTINYGSRAQFDKCCGVCRVGISGIIVTVTLDGKELR